MKKKNNKNNVFLIIAFAVILVLVLLFPKIYEYVNKASLPKIEDTEIEIDENNKQVDEEVLSNLHFPPMRNSIYSKETYYSLNKFTISDMSNEDILYTAFLDMYEGNIVASNVWGTCVTSPKEFSAQYLDLRIKNILGKNVSYKLDDFSVPEDSTSNYKGRWTYDSSNSRFIYNAYCGSVSYSARYYNLEEFIKAEYNKNDIIVYYYVGFAKVENSEYIIYKDANMTNEIAKGTFTGVEDLNNIFKSINKKNKKVYKYTFKDTLCSYNEYCLYEGVWTNGI